MYLRSPLEMAGPPAGVNSELACAVIVPPPLVEVLARYWMVSLPAKSPKLAPEEESVIEAGTDSLPLGISCTEMVCTAVRVSALQFMARKTLRTVRRKLATFPPIGLDTSLTRIAGVRPLRRPQFKFFGFGHPSARGS